MLSIRSLNGFLFLFLVLSCGLTPAWAQDLNVQPEAGVGPPVSVSDLQRQGGISWDKRFSALAPDPTPPRVENLTSGPVVITYRDGVLTVNATNAPLRDVLRAICNQTGTVLELPPGLDEPVVVSLGPAPVRDVFVALLTGSRFNYVMLESPDDLGAPAQIILSANATATVDKVPVRTATQDPRDRTASRVLRAREEDGAAPANDQVEAAARLPESVGDKHNAATPQQEVDEFGVPDTEEDSTGVTPSATETSVSGTNERETNTDSDVPLAPNPAGPAGRRSSTVPTRRR